MNIFLNELSLHGQYLSGAEFEEALSSLNSVLDRVDRAHVEKRVFFCPNLYYAPTVGMAVFSAALEGIRDKSIRILFKRLLNDRLRATNWRPERLHANCSYLWNEQELSDTSPAELAERVLSGGIGFLISAAPSRFGAEKAIHVQKQGSGKAEVYSIGSEPELDEWYLLHPLLGLVGYPLGVDRPPTDTETALVARGRFRRTLKRNHGRVVYLEPSSGRYFCVDNLHVGGAAHLEVFDASGAHLGEASLRGEVDLARADPLKMLN